jgi:hypothetical protein
LEQAATRIAEARASGQFDEEDSEVGEGDLAFTQSNYARTPMVEAPRRLTSHTARQFHRLDKVRQQQLDDFNELYPNGGTWANVPMFLGGAVVTVPIDIAVLRQQLGLPPTDLRLPGAGATALAGIDTVPVDVTNIPETDHAYENDYAENDS